MEICVIELDTGEVRYITGITDEDFSYSVYPTNAVDSSRLTECMVVLAQLQYENYPSLYDKHRVYVEQIKE